MADPLASSPRLLGSATLNHLLESNVNTSREAIKADLAGKIAYNDRDVLRRLRVDDHSNRFVTLCAASLAADNGEEIALLKELVAQASKKMPDQLEKEEKEDVAGDQDKDIKSGNHGSAEEKKMYGPLVLYHSQRLFALPTEYSLSGQFV
jgi:dihydroxyacetone kinase-like predicted kinase